MADRWNKAENDQLYRDRAAFGGQQGYAQQTAQNYTGLGQAAAQRGAYQNNWAQNDASRGQQGQAMGLMQGAATGQAPSQAQALGRNMLDQSLQAQMAGAASARGGSLAQAAAMRGAANQAGAMQQQGMNNLSALRAQEMAQARGDYYGAAAGMRGQDMQQQGMNMQSELAQRQMNQQGQQFNDQLAWNTMRADQEGALQRSALDSQEYLAQKQMNQHSTDRETGVIGSVVGGIGSAAASFFSDVTAKTDVKPLDQGTIDYLATERARLDSLNASNAAHAKAAAQPGLGAALSKGFGAFGQNMGALSDPRSKVLMPMSGPANATMDKVGGGGMDVLGSLKAHSDFGTRFRGDPTGGMMMSDNRAKLAAAWDQGHAAAIADVEKASRMSQADLARRSEGDEYHPAAAAVRAAKAAAWDEGQQAGGRDEIVQHQKRMEMMKAPPVAAQPTPPVASSRAPTVVTAPPPVAASDERAKERVIDLDDDVTMTDPKDEATFQAWKKRYAHPQDDGEDYDLRGAWKAGLKPGPDGHWPDTFKRPNHPTFSDESKYARNEGAKPGHWNGDEFRPYVEPGSERATMRLGAADDRTRHFDESFRRDSRPEQATKGRAYKRAVEDNAGRDADATMAGYAASLAKGSSTQEALARANRSMEGSSYAYKPEFIPPDQVPGEKNVGPMAQNMAADPLAATAVKKDPKTGMLVLDGQKMLKLNSAGIASLQRQVDSLAAAVAKRGRS